MKMTTTWFDPMTTAVNGPDSTDVILDTIIFRGNRGGKKSCGGGRGYCGRQIMSSRNSREELRHCCNDAVRRRRCIDRREMMKNDDAVLDVGCWSCCGAGGRRVNMVEMAGNSQAYLFPPKVAFFLLKYLFPPSKETP